MKKKIGIAMLTLPFIAELVWAYSSVGFWQTAGIFLLVVGLFIYIGIAITLTGSE